MAKKYIDAELLKKGLKELESVIYSNELVGQSMHPYDGGQLHAIKIVKELINSLQQEQPVEETPEPYTGIYDEAYLQEKIALKEKHGSWKDGIKQLEYLNKIYFNEQPSDVDSKLAERLEDISQKGLENAHTIDFKKQAESSKKILQKRRQSSEDLDKEIENVIDNTFCDMNGIAYLGITGYATVEDMKYIARHFYELGKNSK